jgi:predicted nucleic-acid-binding Zn-ribbon protein
MSTGACPKCGGAMEPGRIRVDGNDPRFVADRQTGIIRIGTAVNHAAACVQCGYVEFYLDPATLARKLTD